MPNYVINLNYLISGVKNNLHIIMILDSESEFFNACIENNPAVLDHSHVAWLDRWDDLTMNTIPELIFKKLLPTVNIKATLSLILIILISEIK